MDTLYSFVAAAIIVGLASLIGKAVDRYTRP